MNLKMKLLLLLSSILLLSCNQKKFQKFEDDLSDKNSEIEMLNKELNDRYNKMVMLNKKLNDRNNEIVMLNKKLNDKNNETEVSKANKSSLNSRINKLIEVENRISTYSNREIINIVKKDREYYCPKGIMKSFKVRKVNANIYDVRFELKLPHLSNFDSSVYRIKFLPNDEYTLDLYSGRLCL